MPCKSFAAVCCVCGVCARCIGLACGVAVVEVRLRFNLWFGFAAEFSSCGRGMLDQQPGRHRRHRTLQRLLVARSQSPPVSADPHGLVKAACASLSVVPECCAGRRKLALTSCDIALFGRLSEHQTSYYSIVYTSSYSIVYTDLSSEVVCPDVLMTSDCTWHV